MTEEKRKEILHLISTWHEKDNPARLRYENSEFKFKEMFEQLSRQADAIERSMQITEKDLNIVIC
jgi:hypothetical protein